MVSKSERRKVRASQLVSSLSIDKVNARIREVALAEPLNEVELTRLMRLREKVKADRAHLEEAKKMFRSGSEKEL